MTKKKISQLKKVILMLAKLLYSFSKLKEDNYSTRKKHLLRVLNLESNQKNSKKLIIKFHDLLNEKLYHLNQVEEAEKTINYYVNRLGDIQGYINMSMSEEELKKLHNQKEEYWQQLDKVKNIDSMEINSNIKDKLEAIYNGPLSKMAYEEYQGLTKKIDNHLKELRKEAKDKATMYRILEKDLLEIRDNLEYANAMKLYRQIRDTKESKYKSSGHLKQVAHIRSNYMNN